MTKIQAIFIGIFTSFFTNLIITKNLIDKLDTTTNDIKYIQDDHKELNEYITYINKILNKNNIK